MVMLRLPPDVIADDCGADSANTHIELEPIDCWRQAICVQRGGDGEPTVVRIFMQPKDRPALECMPCIDIMSCEPREPGPVPCWEESHLVQCPGRITGGDGYISITDLPAISGLRNLEVIIYVDNHEFCLENDPDLGIECRPFEMRRLIQPPWSRDEIIIPIPSSDGILRPLCRARFGFPSPDVRRVRAGRIVVRGNYSEAGDDRYIILAAARFESRYEISWHGDPLGEYRVSGSGCEFVVTDIMSCADLSDATNPPPPPPQKTYCPQDCHLEMSDNCCPLCSNFFIFSTGLYCFDCALRAMTQRLVVCKPTEIIVNGVPYYDCFDYIADMPFLIYAPLPPHRMVYPYFTDILEGTVTIVPVYDMPTTISLVRIGDLDVGGFCNSYSVPPDSGPIVFANCPPTQIVPAVTVFPRPIDDGYFGVHWSPVLTDVGSTMTFPPVVMFVSVRNGVLGGVWQVEHHAFPNLVRRNFWPWLNGYLGELLVLCDA